MKESPDNQAVWRQRHRAKRRTDELDAQDDYNGQATWRRVTEAVSQTRRRLDRCTDYAEFRSAVRSIPTPRASLLDNVLYQS